MLGGRLRVSETRNIGWLSDGKRLFKLTQCSNDGQSLELLRCHGNPFAGLGCCLQIPESGHFCSRPPGSRKDWGKFSARSPNDGLQIAGFENWNGFEAAASDQQREMLNVVFPIWFKMKFSNFGGSAEFEVILVITTMNPII